MPKKRFRFERLDRIGVPDAEEDREFLEHCFIHTGDIDALRSCEDPRRIVIGGTGSGKTALLMKLATRNPRAIDVPPESLALAHITNSNILTFLLQLGVKLDIFFKLLWRHVFTVEILRAHYGLNSEEDQIRFMDRVRTVFSHKHRRAIKYLEDWGNTFWKETDYRITELTTKLEREVEASVTARVPSFSFTAQDATALSEEQKQDVIHRAQHVVNQVQIRELSDILEMLDGLLDDPQKPYYLTIDRLDENWIEDRFRYLLIRALLETVRDFRKIRHAKIVVALRRDLIDRVFRLTRDAGFQEEKFESVYLPLDWTRNELVELLEARLKHLIKRHGKPGDARELLPGQVDGQPANSYIVSRTLMRPRDVIQFVNVCIEQAAGRPTITTDALRHAEGLYSAARLRALADEWNADFPTLFEFIAVLKNRPQLFALDDIEEDALQNMCLEFTIHAEAQGRPEKTRGELCPLAGDAFAAASGAIPIRDFRRKLAKVFYQVGVLGVKAETHLPVEWAHSGRKSISSAQLDNTGIRVAIHPAFWRVLGTRPER